MPPDGIVGGERIPTVGSRFVGKPRRLSACHGEIREVLLLRAATSFKSPINPITNTNPMLVTTHVTIENNNFTDMNYHEYQKLGWKRTPIKELIGTVRV